MAIDTAFRRHSALNPLCPWRGGLAYPSGTIGEAARAAALLLYGGLDVDSPVETVPSARRTYTPGARAGYAPAGGRTWEA